LTRTLRFCNILNEKSSWCILILSSPVLWVLVLKLYQFRGGPNVCYPFVPEGVKLRDDGLAAPDRNHQRRRYISLWTSPGRQERRGSGSHDITSGRPTGITERTAAGLQQLAQGLFPEAESGADERPLPRVSSSRRGRAPAARNPTTPTIGP